jgi:uncharacterized SAM-binding protein YcdF (DUF218 family)
MTPGELKPILTALVLPPAGPLLLSGLGLLLLAARRRVAAGLLLLVSWAGLWLLCSHAFALVLAGALLPPVQPVRPEALAQAQAIVVLGGGVLAEAPEYGAPQPNAVTLGRLRYGASLARRTGKPLAFAGGVGWASAGSGIAPEAEVARAAVQEFGTQFRWVDGRSRDTVENALEMQRLLTPDGVRRVAVVTDAWHMPRALLAFERAGFEVVAAPTGFPAASTRPLLGWLPSSGGLELSRNVIRERLGLWVARF